MNQRHAKRPSHCPDQDIQSGRIISRFGAEMIVEAPNGQLHRCTGKRRLNFAVCGDIVDWKYGSADRKVITAIHPRHNELKRAIRHGPPKIIAANIDQIAIVIACLPTPMLDIVDRYLVAAASLPCQAFIVINKCDLQCFSGEFETTFKEYRAIGYDTVKTSAKEAIGISDLKTYLRDKISILVGQSGVGKSSLVKLLLPNIEIRIGALSATRVKGKHTTTTATLYPLPVGGALIDSPGIRDFDPPAVAPDTLTRGFLEFVPFIGHCRFHNCTHTVEPGCALLKAVKDGKISLRRMQSYQRLIQTIVR